MDIPKQPRPDPPEQPPRLPQIDTPLIRMNPADRADRPDDTPLFTRPQRYRIHRDTRIIVAAAGVTEPEQNPIQAPETPAAKPIVEPSETTQVGGPSESTETKIDNGARASDKQEQPDTECKVQSVEDASAPDLRHESTPERTADKEKPPHPEADPAPDQDTLSIPEKIDRAIAAAPHVEYMTDGERTLGQLAKKAFMVDALKDKDLDESITFPSALPEPHIVSSSNLGEFRRLTTAGYAKVSATWPEEERPNKDDFKLLVDSSIEHVKAHGEAALSAGLDASYALIFFRNKANGDLDVVSTAVMSGTATKQQWLDIFRRTTVGAKFITDNNLGL